MIDLLSIQDKPKKTRKSCFEINAFKVFERQSYSYKRPKCFYKIDPYFIFTHKNWSVFSGQSTSRFYTNKKGVFLY